MRGEFIDVGGHRLYYYAAGTRGGGDPIVLLHGFPTSSHLWSELVPLLPRGHRVVVLDLLGHGRSDPPGNADLTLRGHARRVVALLDALGIGRSTIVGHQMGGSIAQALVTGWPERVGRVALLHSMGFDVTVTGALALVRAFSAPAQLVPRQALLRFVHRELLRWYTDQNRGRHSADQYLRPFSTGAGHRVLLRHLKAMNEADTTTVSEAMQGVRVPVAIVTGTRDTTIPASVATRLQRLIPRATLDFIDDVRHLSPEEAPERIAGVVERLVARDA
jgi:pimeloyl-ACP methyl ester carboxylesterase